MPIGQVFTRMVLYGVVLGALDALGGRLLQAAPDPSTVLPLLATGWAAYQLARADQRGVAFPAALVLWISYMGTFVATAHALVGWNNSVPWHPQSTTWMLTFGAAAPVTAALGQLAGTRAATHAKQAPRD